MNKLIFSILLTLLSVSSLAQGFPEKTLVKIFTPYEWGKCEFYEYAYETPDFTVLDPHFETKKKVMYCVDYVEIGDLEIGDQVVVCHPAQQACYPAKVTGILRHVDIEPVEVPVCVKDSGYKEFSYRQFNYIVDGQHEFIVRMPVEQKKSFFDDDWYRNRQFTELVPVKAKELKPGDVLYSQHYYDVRVCPTEVEKSNKIIRHGSAWQGVDLGDLTESTVFIDITVEGGHNFIVGPADISVKNFGFFAIPILFFGTNFAVEAPAFAAIVASLITSAAVYWAISNWDPALASNQEAYFNRMQVRSKEFSFQPHDVFKPWFEARGDNKMAPDVEAEGSHTTLKPEFVNGNPHSYETWRDKGENRHPKDPHRWESEKRFDGGPYHEHNKIPTPHVHEGKNVRPARPDEIPLGAKQ